MSVRLALSPEPSATRRGEHRVRLAERRDLSALAQLADAQATARRALDPRLPTGAQHIPFLSSAQTLGDVLVWRHHATFVAERDGVVIGGVNLHKIEQKDRDQFASYYPRRFASIGLLAAHADATPTVLSDLLVRAREQAAHWQTPALLIHNASTDGALRETLNTFGFRAYYQYALHTPTSTPTPIPSVPCGVRSTPQGTGAGRTALPRGGVGVAGEGETSSSAVRVPGEWGRVLVRRATKRDLDDVVRIGMDSVHYHASLERTLQVPRNEHKKMRQRFEAVLAEPNHSALFVAEAQRRVVGFYSIYVQAIDASWTPPLFAAGRYGLIAEVAVDKPVRGHGIGRQLFATVEQWFRERSAFGVWLIYLTHNPLSSKFWPSLGFEPVWEVLLRDS